MAGAIEGPDFRFEEQDNPCRLAPGVTKYYARASRVADGHERVNIG